MIALGIISSALVISLAKLALPWLAAHPEVVEKNLSTWLNAQVGIDGVQSDWQVRPKLKVHTLTIGQNSAGANAGLNIENAEIELDPFGFIPGRRWVQDLSILGAQLTLAQTSSGWQLEGLGHREAITLSNAQQLALLNSVGQLSIRNAAITVRPLTGKLSHFDGVSLILRRQGEVLRAGLQFSAPTRNGLASRGQIALRAHWLERTETLTLYGETVATTLDDLQGLVALFRGGDVGNESQKLAGTLDSKLWLTLINNKPSRGYAKISTLDARQQATMSLEFGSRNGRDWLGALRLAGINTKAVAKSRRSGELADQSSSLLFAATLDDLGSVSIVAGHADTADTRVAGIDLEAFSQAAGAHLALDQARTLAEFAVRGKLTELRAQFGVRRPWRTEFKVQALSILPKDRIPGVSNADISVQADAQAVSLALSGKDFVLNAPISFRKPIHVEKISLSAALWPAAGGWAQGYSAEVSDIALSAPGYDATAFASVEKNAEEVPQFFVTLDVSRGDIAHAGQFWAIDKMPPKVIAWLDAALIRGQTGRARAVYRGPLKRFEFPFRAAQGRFEAVFELKTSEIKFAPDWPNIQIAAGDFSLINDSLVVHRARGEIAGNPIVSLSGGIARFSDPIAQFQINGGQNTASLLALLRASPIGRDYGTNFSGLSALGNAAVALQLSLPLRADLGERVVAGVATLRQSSLLNPDWRLSLNGLDGQITFDRQGFTARNLLGLQNALPIALSAAVGASHTGVSNVIIDASLRGEMEPNHLFGQEAVLAPILAKISGTSQWDVRVRTVADAVGKSLTTTELVSDLKGVAIELPTPLGKRAESQRVLRLSLPSEENSQRALVLEIDGGVRFVAELGSDAATGPDGVERAGREFRGTLGLGGQGSSVENADSQNTSSLQNTGALQNTSALPKAGLRIIGKLAELNLAEWAALVGSTATAAGSVRLADITLQATQLTGALAQFPGALRLNATPSAQGWKLNIDSAAASGHITWRTDLPTQAITAQFTHLYLPSSEAEPEDPAEELEKTQLQIDPRAIPTLHLYVEDLSVGSAKLGATRWESFPTPKGMRIDLLESKSSDLTLTGSGDWQGIGAQGLSSFKLRFSAQDLGRMLAGLGFSGHVAGGQTLAEIDADWQGAPIEFALARLHGRLNVWVGSGRFLELDPGAGRLFGLLSVRELPRRLALDFRDFFQTGMSFTEIRGDFRFDAGNAYTEGLKIKAPAADITVIGRTGLSARDYEQTALVSPKIGVLPMVGAIAGGPAGAAAGLIAQRVLEGESALAANYKITGSWEKPLVIKQATPREAKREAQEVVPR